MCNLIQYLIFATSGPEGLHKIASRIHSSAAATYNVLAEEADLAEIFDTFTIDVSKISKTSSNSHQNNITISDYEFIINY